MTSDYDVETNLMRLGGIAYPEGWLYHPDIHLLFYAILMVSLKRPTEVSIYFIMSFLWCPKTPERGEHLIYYYALYAVSLRRLTVVFIITY